MGIIAFTLELAFYTSHPKWWPKHEPLTWFEQQVLQVWSVYTQFDPIFEDPPLWLRIMCWIEVLCFGPLYLVSAWALSRNAAWAKIVILPFCGALFYSTIVYFALELGSDRIPGTNDLVVLAVNAPWTILPAVLVYCLVLK